MNKNTLASRFFNMFHFTSKRVDLGEGARLNHKNFTRNRNLTCSRLLLLIASGIRLPLQLATDNFFVAIGHKEDTVTKQAVSKARTNFNPDIIKELFTDTAKGFSKCDDLVLWNKKYRLCAIDGSDIALDNAFDLKEYFGCSGRAKNATTGMCSIAFDPLNNVILDASLDPYITDERTASKKHIENVLKLPTKRGIHNLFLMDRGYPSREFIGELMNKKHKFVMRVRNKFNLDFDAVKNDETVAFTWKSKVYRVRVIKVALKTGEIETLVTNLDQKELPKEQAGTIYFERWSIETKYDSLKNKLELGNFSGRRVVVVMQDFWATMYLANLITSIECQTDSIIAAKTAEKDNKYEQTTNENRLISKFREAFFKCLLEVSVAKRTRMFEDLVDDIARRPVEIKPDRIVPRKIPRKIKYHDRRKSVI